MNPLNPRKAALLAGSALAATVIVGLVPAFPAQGRDIIPNLAAFPNPAGVSRTFSTGGDIDLSNPFFQSLGTNGRACVTCHNPASGWTITPALAQARFEATEGLDPLFRTNDGSNSPAADASTLAARRQAYSMLLDKGLIRVALPIPAGAEFELLGVDDPYGFAGAAELSLFRRPLPSTNLGFLSAVMWDGRENQLDPAIADRTIALRLQPSLAHQANDATTGHAQASQDLTVEQREEIVRFELALSSAQAEGRGTGLLDANGARGGPVNLSQQGFFLGINDPLGHNPIGTPFDRVAAHLFDAWADSASPGRRSVARGQAIFNTHPIRIADVAGLNDDLAAPFIMGTCTTCHDTPNVGNHSAIAPLNIGLADAARRTPDMPLYTLRNLATGLTTQTTDPGRALITGKWKDIGRFKGPILRNLAARPPYFHNGAAATLGEVVDFYQTRFALGLTPRERADLIAFLESL
jgi:cytochrome c peroxidase